MSRVKKRWAGYLVGWLVYLSEGLSGRREAFLTDRADKNQLTRRNVPLFEKIG